MVFISYDRHSEALLLWPHPCTKDSSVHPQAAARVLARELPSPPIELALTEAALALARRCLPAPPTDAPAQPADDEDVDDRGPPPEGAPRVIERHDPVEAAVAGPSPADVVPAAVLAFLRRKVLPCTQALGSHVRVG